jgi:CRISPR-associated protein Csm4
MEVFRLKIRPYTSFITPWHSDSIFGALCWVIQKSEGEEELRKVLDKFIEGNPPFIISNGFPGDLFPRPLISRVKKIDGNGLSKQKLLQIVREGKQIKKIEYLTLEEFNELIYGGNLKIHFRPKPYADVAVMHKMINRMTGTTAEGGELFNTVERFSNINYWSIYIKTEKEWAAQIKKWFGLLGKTGFGKRKSVGKGSFEVEGFEAFDDFKRPEDPNAFVVLSNYIPSSCDPVHGFYRTFMKYGKLDGEFAIEGDPFKTPLLMIPPGAVFMDSPVRNYYGRMVEGVSNNYPHVVHYGYGFTLPIHLNDDL